MGGNRSQEAAKYLELPKRVILDTSIKFRSTSTLNAPIASNKDFLAVHPILRRLRVSHQSLMRPSVKRDSFTLAELDRELSQPSSFIIKYASWDAARHSQRARNVE